MLKVTSDNIVVKLTDENELVFESNDVPLSLGKLARMMSSLGVIDEFVSVAKRYQYLKPADPHFTED